MSNNNTNYIVSIAKILEHPKKILINENSSVVQCRVQLPLNKNKRIVSLAFWGNLAQDVEKYYNINDYVIIEGFISLCPKLGNNSKVKNLKMVKVTVSKIYPFLLTSNN